MTAVPRTIHAADLFCGAGGTSTGLVRACDRMGYATDLLAVNHWSRAVETHQANHPSARHACARIDQVDLEAAFPGRKLDILVASPECTHHSRARGGKPRSDQARASAWDVVRWVAELQPSSVIVENVIEFEDWGPLGSRGKPLKSKKGEVFRTWVASIASHGYAVEWRVLNAADYGGATTRRRLFIQARRGRRAPQWPTPSHSKTPDLPCSQGTKRWRPAREVIDWSLRGTSIFDRKKPLKPTTLRRIEEGLRRFGGRDAEPFLVVLRGTDPKRQVPYSAKSIEDPMPTVSAGGEHLGLAQPFVVEVAHGVNPAGSGRGNSRRCRSIDEPLNSPTAGGVAVGLVEPFLTPYYGHSTPSRVGDPLPTVTTRDRFALVQPFVLSQASGGAPRPVSEPLPTLCTDGAIALVVPRKVDVLFRMLQRHELSAAMGFPADYLFSGNRSDVNRQIGNAVEVNMAEALCYAALTASVAA